MPCNAAIIQKYKVFSVEIAIKICQKVLKNRKTWTFILFLDKDTGNFYHVLVDIKANTVPSIDPVLDFDPAAGKISYDNANNVIGFVKSQGLILLYHRNPMPMPIIYRPRLISKRN